MQTSLSHKWKYLPFSQTLQSEGCLFIAITNQPINLPMDQARQMCSTRLVHQYMHTPLLTSAVKGGRTGLFVFGWCPQDVTKPQSHCRRELMACCFLHDKAFCEWGGCGNLQVLTSKALLLPLCSGLMVGLHHHDWKKGRKRERQRSQPELWPKTRNKRYKPRPQ